VRLAGLAVAVAALVAIGTFESSISVDQLSELPGRGRPALALGGIGLTAVSVVASAVVYVCLGIFLARIGSEDGRAVRSGAIVGVFAGLVGGSIRALLVRDYLDDVVDRFGLPPELVSWSLLVFVTLSVLVSGASGAAITWLGFRSGRRRPSPRPRS
jgi:hypothetical protein